MSTGVADVSVIKPKNHAVSLRLLFERSLPDEAYTGALDPEYDLMARREKDRPRNKKPLA
jgi:hypothetical protein